MLSGTNLEYTRFYNQRVVLEAIRLHEPVSRAEIARRTGLTNQTVSNIVGELLGRGVVQVGSKRMGRRGQPALEISLNPQGAFSIGLHLDRDHLAGVLMDLKGTVHRQVSYEAQMPSPAKALKLMQKAVLELQKAWPRNSDLWGLGVALPGPMEMSSGRVVAVPNFPGWGDVPVRDWLEERLQILVYLENDATAAATGERWHGVGRDFPNFFYVYFGVGMGGGVILGGHPYRGASGNAGEFGHTCFQPGAKPQPVGEFVSLEELYRAAGVSSPSALEALFERRDARVLAWLDRAAELLAPGLVSVESLLDPDALIFGGRFPQPLIAYLVGRLGEQMPLYRLPGKPLYPKLLLGQAQQDAACLGAATLPFYEEIAPSHHLLLKKTGSGVF
ncbi:MAG: ROK family transcriptional regulator [Meiothermus sp.]